VLTPAEAAAAIAAAVAPLPDEVVPLACCAGRVLREPVRAERDAPPFDRVAMDGIAVASGSIAAGTRRLRIAATLPAGHPPGQLDDPSACIEVMTGASLPGGCDAVIQVEQISQAAGAALLAPEATVERWQNVHRRGTDARAGDLLLAPGIRLRGPEIAIAASAGLAALRVARRPSVAVISTGDELIDPGKPILDHQVRRSNSYALAAALSVQAGAVVEDAHVVDDPAAIAGCIAAALDRHDALVLSGGVSAGRFDHVPGVLASLGVRQVFHRIAQRPGKPMWFGVAANGKPVFALPGNPVSVLVCLARYVLPALARAAGLVLPPPPPVALARTVSFKPALAWFLPVVVEYDAEGRAWAEPKPTQGSGDFNALAGTTGFVELPPGPATVGRADAVPFYPW
jgi:molybdopterin molybdotransferase